MADLDAGRPDHGGRAGLRAGARPGPLAREGRPPQPPDRADTVFAKRGTGSQAPLLILPPWINKFYILDMQPKNSVIRYLVGQGFTVFVISWKNPDASMDDIDIEDYMDLGPLEASDVAPRSRAAPRSTPWATASAARLLTLTLATIAAKGDDRFNAASFMVSMQDFARVGDTAVFMDKPAIDLIEQQMMERGYLDSREMSNMFSLLRSNDLIWSSVVNN